MNGKRITIRIEESDNQKIEAFIKRKYPDFRNVSQVVRAALQEFLEEN
jgi:Arc/MetJ-type ribon-helix-helix transcriptional regulator